MQKLPDNNRATMIMRTKDAKQAKKFSGDMEHKAAWDAQKIDVMRTVVEEKFMQNPDLCHKLVATGQNSLIEATLDGFWGAKATLNSKSLKKGTWQGANFLGKILGEVRTEMRRELGLPEPPTPQEQTNAPMDTSAAPPAPPTPSEGTGGTAVANANPTTTQDTSARATQTQGQVKSQTPNRSQQNRGRGKKNKERQSPIPEGPKSSDIHLYSSQVKKARIYSPNSALPPKSKITGDLFTFAGSDGPVISSMV